jgi:hypothetical protein
MKSPKRYQLSVRRHRRVDTALGACQVDLCQIVETMEDKGVRYPRPPWEV